jgi:hypothetical protein
VPGQHVFLAEVFAGPDAAQMLRIVRFDKGSDFLAKGHFLRGEFEIHARFLNVILLCLSVLCMRRATKAS